MEMAFMQQGGIKDDGMTKDPVSGNPIPPGSMAKEVRDDIPAMLSEGEYVVPADVLRFYGVNFFEDLRNKAKSGLQNMEKNGRIGGEPLSPQQVQQNMGQSGVTMQANQGGAVGYQGGGGAIPDVYMDQAKALNPNPIDLSQYGVVGGSTFSSNPQAEANSITRTEIYVNAETGDTRSVNFVSSGTETKIVPPSDEQYTRPPYYLQGSSALKKAQQTVPTGGGGSDPKDPPESKPKQPFGTGVDWTDPLSFAKQFEDPTKAEKFLKGVGPLSALAGPFGMAAVGIGSTALSLKSISSVQAAKIIAEAQGLPTTGYDEILKKVVARSNLAAQALDGIAATGKNDAKSVLDRLGMRYTERDGNLIFSDDDKTYNNLKNRETKIRQQRDSNRSAASTALANIESGGGAYNEDGTTIQDILDKSGAEGSENREATEAALKKITEGLESGAKTGTIQLNKGGLMTKAKKKK